MSAARRSCRRSLPPSRSLPSGLLTRHADASRCTVRLAVNGALELTVVDDGHGAPAGTTPGVGWTSMTERAAELGGSCTISSRNRGGTVVRAVLPLPSTQSEPAEEIVR